MIGNLLVVSISALILTFISTPFIIKLAQRLHLVDNAKRPHPAHTHSGTIPRAGGVALYLGIIIAILIFLPLTKAMWGVVLGATVLLIVGIADDNRDINPYIRFLTNIAAAFLVVGAGINIPFINNPLTGTVIHLDNWRIPFTLFGSHSIIPLADLFAILWIVWTMNIVGWSSGVDGQLPGFVAIAALTLGLLAMRFISEDPSQYVVVTLAFITMGAYLGFLPWNFYPQKILPGYSGKTLAGFLLATLAILAQAKVGTAVLVLGLPMIDAGYTLFRRIIHKHSPVWADRGHLHHRLLDIGWGRRRIAIFYWMISGLMGIIALTVTTKVKFFVVILVAVWLIGLIMWVEVFKSFQLRRTRRS